MRKWFVQLLVDIGLVRPRDAVEGAGTADPHHRPRGAPPRTPG